MDGLWSGLQDGLRWPSVVRLMMDSVSIRDHALESVKLNFGVLILPYAAGRFLPDLAETLIGSPVGGLWMLLTVVLVCAFLSADCVSRRRDGVPIMYLCVRYVQERFTRVLVLLPVTL